MAIVTISRGSYSRGKEVAEKVAAKLGYECIARDVVLEASEEFNVPEIQLHKAIEDPPSIFERIGHSKDKYIAFIRAALLKHFQRDNVVYHGLAGHFFLQGISHALKVRILADLEHRVQLVVRRDGVTEREALNTLARKDRGRQDWAQHLYGIDPTDPALYDLVIHVGQIGTDEAADLIVHAAGIETFAATPRSQAAMSDLALAAMVKALLIEDQPEVEVEVTNGRCRVRVERSPRILSGNYSGFRDHLEEDIRHRILWRTRDIAGLEEIEIELG